MSALIGWDTNHLITPMLIFRRRDAMQERAADSLILVFPAGTGDAFDLGTLHANA